MDENQLLTLFLADRDARCPVCGYNLRGNRSSACPECGVSLDLRVGSVHLRLGAWIAALVGTCLPLGLVANLTAVVALSLLRGGSSRASGWPTLITGLAMSALLAAVLWLLIWKRRSFFRKAPRRQRDLAVGATVLGLMFAGGFLSLFAAYAL